MAKSSEIRTSKKSERIGWLGGQIMRLVCATLRIEIVDRAGVSRPGELPGPIIMCLWHDSIFIAPAAWKKSGGRYRQASVLTSASHDGAILAKAVSVFGIGAVRGSTSRRAVAALVALRKTLRDGIDICFTPDGPRGPRRVFQAGALKLAETGGALIVPIHVDYSSAWTLKTWDRFRIPKPFSKARFTLDTALAVPPDLSEDEFETWRQRIESILRRDEPSSDDNPRR